MVDALDAPHVASRDRMETRDVARMPLSIEAFSDRRQHGVGAPEGRRRRDGDDGAVRNEAGCVRGGNDFLLGHCLFQTLKSIAVSAPDRAASSVATATLSDLTPSSPVADGAPR